MYYLKRYPDVITYFQWLYRISESYPWNQIFAVRMIGAAYYQLEDFPLAHANLQQSIEMSIRIGHDYGIYASFIYLSGILAKSGQSFLAVKLLGFLEKQYENFYKGMDRLDRIEYNQIKANLEQAVDQKEFHTLWEQGREMTLEEALNAVKDTANINQRISQTGNHNH